MPPEQASADRGGVCPASDVYALGALLYELLAGRPPFEGATPVDIILQVLSDDPVSPRKLQPKLPRNLETICLKCLQKDPQKRYPTAKALAEDLRRFLAGEPILARRAGMAHRARRWCARNPITAGLTATLALALTAGTGISIYLGLTASAEKQRADANADKEGASAQSVRGLTYAVHIMKAQRAWEDGQTRLALQLLSELRPKSDEPDRRGFEWHYLHRLCNKQASNLALADVGNVSAFALSTDGRRLATAREIRRESNGGWSVEACELDIWDTQSGHKLLTIKRHRFTVSSIEFSPDGGQLVSCGWPPDTAPDGRQHTIKVWDAKTGKELRGLKPEGTLETIAFSPDGRLVAAAAGHYIHVLDAASGQEVRELGGNIGVTSLMFSADGKKLASAGIAPPDDKGVGLIVFDLDRPATGWTRLRDGRKLLHIIADKAETFIGIDAKRVLRVVCSSDGRHVASAHGDTAVRLWEPATGKEPRLLKGHTDDVWAIAFHPDGTRLASSDTAGFVKLWDVASGQELLTLKQPRPMVVNANHLTFSPGGHRLAAVGSGGPVTLWDARPMNAD